jgi:hypothetical protein
MTSSEKKPGSDIDDDDYRRLLDEHGRSLTFNCYEFSRHMTADHKGVPALGRWVTASKCLCTHQSDKICDPTQLYEMHFYRQLPSLLIFRKDTDLKIETSWPPDAIGSFIPEHEHAAEGVGHANINVPPQLMDLLWEAALAADGVIREISFSVKPQKRNGQIHVGYWWVFYVSLHEKIWDGVELRVDKDDVPRLSPPRADPAVVEMRGVQAKLKDIQAELEGVHERLSQFAGWPGIVIIAFAVVIGLLITDFLRH